MKQNTYIITLSKVFPKTHAKAGKETLFDLKFAFGLANIIGGKFHTIRANYELWRKRFEEIKSGRAKLSVRQWSGKPYRSKQLLLSDLDINDGIGLQCLTFPNCALDAVEIDGHPFEISEETLVNIAGNDGLDLDDWREWFKNYDLTKPMAIIHFTNFRY